VLVHSPSVLPYCEGERQREGTETKQIALTASIPDAQAYLACVQFITLSICLDEVANLIKLIILGVFIVNPLPFLWMKLTSNSY